MKDTVNNGRGGVYATLHPIAENDMTVNHLFQALQLSHTYQDAADLERLETWCQHYISQDYVVEGSAAERYQAMYTFVDNYGKVFESHLAMDWNVTQAALDDRTICQYAGWHGYDRFIANEDKLTPVQINTADKYGMTPLHFAAQKGHIMTVRALLARGADVQLYNLNKKLPIQSALFVPILHDKNYMVRKQQLIRELIPHTPNAYTLQDSAGNTILHNLVEVPGFDEIVCDLLHSHPEMALISNNVGLYPIHTAILNQQTVAVHALLAIQGVLDLKDGRGRPLSFYRQ